MRFRKKILFVLFLSLFAIGSVYFYNESKSTSNLANTSLEGDKYVRFGMEVYDKIAKIYWMKSSDADLASLFKLSIEKVTGSPVASTTLDRTGTTAMLTRALTLATSTEAKKQMIINISIVSLYNIAPVGRNQILSQKQETAFRENVANINPGSDLYGQLGLATGANIKDVEEAYNEKVATLKSSTTPEAKEELKKVEYSHMVLANKDSKSLYDEAKIEPTLYNRKIGNTLYIDMSKISPTTLIEFARTIDNASTTKNLDSMIIDFRGNLGGSLDFLPNFFGLFAGKDQYVFDFFQQGNYVPQRSVQPKYLELDKYKEIAILTDNMTQSTAELTTATFKRFNMAKVVGVTTRGWGTVENTYPMETEIDPGEKYLLLLVNSITLREDGQPIEGRGVDPNVDIRKPTWKNELPKFFKSTSLISAIKQVVK